MMIWLGSLRGSVWKRIPSQPCDSLCCLKLRAATVSAKTKNVRSSPELFVEPLDQQSVLVIEHRLEPRATDVAIGRAVNRVAKLHVVGRHGLRDRAGRAADLEKAPRHFLPGADLGEGPVAFDVEIDLERFFVRSDFHLRVHRFKMRVNRRISTAGDWDACAPRGRATLQIGAQRPLTGVATRLQPHPLGTAGPESSLADR